MSKLARHPVKPDLVQKQIAIRAQVIASTLEQVRGGDARRLNQLGMTARAYAGYLVIADPQAPELCRALQLGAEAYAAIMQLAAPSPASSVEVPLDGQPVRLAVADVSDVANASNWLAGFYLAAIRRDQSILDRLSDTPLEILRRSSTRVDEYFYLYVGALQGFFKHEPDTSTRLLAALKATDPAQVHVGSVDYALDIIVPEMEILYRYLLRDAEGFNQALTRALELHRQYWSKGADRKIYPDGFLALGPTALAGFASDAGLPVEVESDYLPMRLVQGGCR